MGCVLAWPSLENTIRLSGSLGHLFFKNTEGLGIIASILEKDRLRFRGAKELPLGTLFNLSEPQLPHL